MENTLRKYAGPLLGLVVLVGLLVAGFMSTNSPGTPPASRQATTATSTPTPDPTVTVYASHLKELKFTISNDQPTLSPDALFTNGGTAPLDPEFRGRLAAAGFELVLNGGTLTGYVDPERQGYVVAWVDSAGRLVAYQIDSNYGRNVRYICAAPDVQQLSGSRSSVREFPGHVISGLTGHRYGAPGVIKGDNGKEPKVVCASIT